MFLLGVLITIGAAVAFGIMGALTIWGGLGSVRAELLRGFVSANPTAGDRALTLLLVVVPLVITGLFGLLSAGWMLMVAFGLS